MFLSGILNVFWYKLSGVPVPMVLPKGVGVNVGGVGGKVDTERGQQSRRKP